MWSDLMVLAGLAGGVLGVFELSVRLEKSRGGPGTRDESMIRAAMAGPEGAVVRAEFRRHGIEGPASALPGGFQ
jgi:hypothetical protein